MIPVTVPDLGLPMGASIVVSCWLARAGDEVVAGDRVVELLLGDTTFDVSAPASGRLVDVAVDIDESVGPGTLLGRIAPSAES